MSGDGERLIESVAHVKNSLANLQKNFGLAKVDSVVNTARKVLAALAGANEKDLAAHRFRNLNVKGIRMQGDFPTNGNAALVAAKIVVKASEAKRRSDFLQNLLALAVEFILEGRIAIRKGNLPELAAELVVFGGSHGENLVECLGLSTLFVFLLEGASRFLGNADGGGKAVALFSFLDQVSAQRVNRRVEHIPILQRNVIEGAIRARENATQADTHGHKTLDSIRDELRVVIAMRLPKQCVALFSVSLDLVKAGHVILSLCHERIELQ